MAECLTRQQIEDYAARRMAPEDMLRLNRHVSACPACKAAVLAQPPLVAAAARTMISLSPDAAACPSGDSLARFVDGELTGARCAAVGAHVRLCPGCAAVVRDLRRLLHQAVPDRNALPAGSQSRSRGAFSRGPVAIAAGGAMLLLFAVVALLQPNANAPAPRVATSVERAIEEDSAGFDVYELPDKNEAAGNGSAESARSAETREKRIAVVVSEKEPDLEQAARWEAWIREKPNMSFAGRQSFAPGLGDAAIASQTADVADYALVLKPVGDEPGARISLVNTSTREQMAVWRVGPEPSVTMARVRDYLMDLVTSSSSIATGLRPGQPKQAPTPKMMPAPRATTPAPRATTPAPRATMPAPRATTPAPGNSATGRPLPDSGTQQIHEPPLAAPPADRPEPPPDEPEAEPNGTDKSAE